MAQLRQYQSCSEIVWQTANTFSSRGGALVGRASAFCFERRRSLFFRGGRGVPILDSFPQDQRTEDRCLSASHLHAVGWRDAAVRAQDGPDCPRRPIALEEVLEERRSSSQSLCRMTDYKKWNIATWSKTDVSVRLLQPGQGHPSALVALWRGLQRGQPPAPLEESKGRTSPILLHLQAYIMFEC